MKKLLRACAVAALCGLSFLFCGWTAITASAPSDFGTERVLIDLDASGPRTFSRLEITQPYSPP